MTGEEKISIARLALKVDHMDENMVTKELLRAEILTLTTALKDHIDYTRTAAVAEAKRLDSILDVNATAASLDKERAVDQAAILAKQVETVAQTARDLVAATAVAQAESQSQQFAPILTRLGKLEDKQNENIGAARYTDPMLAGLTEKLNEMATALSEGKGESKATDPAMAAFIIEMRLFKTSVTDALAENKGKGVGANSLWGYIVGGAGFLAVILKVMGVY